MGKTGLSIGLRLLAVVFYLTAAIVMFFSHQNHEIRLDEDIIYRVNVGYNQWDGLQFVAIISVIGCIYSLILFLPSGSPLWKTVVVLDVVVNLVVGASLGVGWQTYSLMKNGNIHVGWSPVCNVLSVFCKEVVISLSFCSAGFLASFVLLMCTLCVTVDPLLLEKS